MCGSGELAVEIDGFMAALMNEIFRDLKIIYDKVSQSKGGTTLFYFQQLLKQSKYF